MALFENREVLALDKPAGLSMATSGRTDVVAKLLEACGEKPRRGLLLVHRLDVGTSGVVLLAKGPAAHRTLSRAFQDGEVRKAYRALVWGHLVPPAGIFEDPIGRDPKDGRRMKARRDGKPAVTRYETLEEPGEISDLRLSPETGRTHQIRVHLAAHGHPIVGDDLYGAATRWESVRDPRRRRALARVARALLHAERIELPELQIDVTAPLPTDYVRLLEGTRS